MKVVMLTLLFVCLTASGLAETPKCRVCEKPLEGKFFQMDDKARGGKVDVCPDCAKLESHCFACGLPVKPEAMKLPDGRFLCARDAKDAILDDGEAKTICLETRDELDRLLWRFLTFPRSNIVLTIVDRFTLESLFKSPDYSRQCTSIFGATRSSKLGERTSVHSISVLSGLSRSRLQAVAAHEFSHAWLNDNLRAERTAALSPDAIEAFCELIAYEFMDQQKNESEKKVIRENPYTRGQLDAFLAAEAPHGFNALVEWIKSGESAKLDANDPDGVRQVNVKGAATVPGTGDYISRKPAQLPETLTLKNISGPAARRLAIINDRTFGVNDLAKMRLANTNLVIRCLEIRTNSILIQLEGGGGKQELFLPPAP